MTTKPKTPLPLEGRDYYCGGCTGHRVVACPECMDGCDMCLGQGFVKCPTCVGGTVPQPPPDWD